MILSELSNQMAVSSFTIANALTLGNGSKKAANKIAEVVGTICKN
jgi:hypothetical protein